MSRRSCKTRQKCMPRCSVFLISPLLWKTQQNMCEPCFRDSMALPLPQRTPSLRIRHCVMCCAMWKSDSSCFISSRSYSILDMRKGHEAQKHQGRKASKPQRLKDPRSQGHKVTRPQGFNDATPQGRKATSQQSNR